MDTLRVEVYRHEDNRKVGEFFVPDWADDKWLERNMPSMFHGIQVLADAMVREVKDETVETT